MSKETRELLKTIIANQEIMMKHLKMASPASSPGKATTKPEAKRPVAKKPQSRSKGK